MPNLPMLVAVQVIAFVFVSAPLVSINSVVSVVVPFKLRGLGFAMVGIYLFLVGGLLGGSLTGLISDAIGEAGALAIVVPTSCLIGGLLIAYGSRFVREDIALVAEELREDRDERARMAAAPNEISQLQVRNLDFSYGPVQVLFGVDIDVRKGEILALLGTNGAGKSTLLRSVSGLGLPDRGVIRFEGRTVTYSSAEDRVRLGIVQVPGGRATFPTLTVRENLVAGAWSFVWNTSRVNERIESVLELFPRLRERLEQAAGTLSGGEQQMLALAKALLLEPRLLLIDELSLGLAPAVVQELLGVVERLRDDGVTVVLVEQSVNVALSIADRAIFMEKGEVRFEGPAKELLERDDLIRAVFLGTEGG
jgi:ABC-type branched-subunit amino acid transport system ATPase component